MRRDTLPSAGMEEAVGEAMVVAVVAQMAADVLVHQRDGEE